MLEKAYAQVELANVTLPAIDSIADVFALITNILIGVGIALVVIFLIIGGIQYITARGDVKQAEQARSALTNAVIGFIIVLAAITIRIIVTNLLNVDVNNIQSEQYVNEVLPL